MQEIIIKLPYQEITMPRNCCHCGSYDAEEKIEIAKPASQIVEVEREGGVFLRKIKSISAPIYMCKNCLKTLNQKKKLFKLISISALLFFIIGTWSFAMSLIYDISHKYNGHIAGLILFFGGIFSIGIIFAAINFPAIKANHFIGVQILSYNPRKIVIRFFNPDFANKFIDLNNVKEEHIFKRKG